MFFSLPPSFSLSLSIYIYIYVCVCVCVWGPKVIKQVGILLLWYLLLIFNDIFFLIISLIFAITIFDSFFLSSASSTFFVCLFHFYSLFFQRTIILFRFKFTHLFSPGKTSWFLPTVLLTVLSEKLRWQKFESYLRLIQYSCFQSNSTIVFSHCFYMLLEKQASKYWWIGLVWFSFIAYQLL